jgi:DNA-binding GntR family transcriptional regulator
MNSGSRLADRAAGFQGRSGAPRQSAATRLRDLTELRLLLELSALRELADRGLCDGELAVARKLADATLRPARTGDLPGYLQADITFHLYLVELTGDLARSRVAQLLLPPGPGQAPPGGESGKHVAASAREHCELVSMLADDAVSAAGELLRHHIAGPCAGRPAPARGSPGGDPFAPEGS